jgi:hypothetical protein
MLSLGITLMVSLSAAPATAVVAPSGVTCADEPASPAVEWVMLPTVAPAEAEPAAYATPVEVECPTPSAGAVALGDATCDETPPPDLWYRISTPGALEHATATIASGRRAHGGRAALSAGAPAPDTRSIAPPDSQPLALSAVPTLLPSGLHSGVVVRSDTPPARTLAPPDRPPRV